MLTRSAAEELLLVSMGAGLFLALLLGAVETTSAARRRLLGRSPLRPRAWPLPVAACLLFLTVVVHVETNSCKCGLFAHGGAAGLRGALLVLHFGGCWALLTLYGMRQAGAAPSLSRAVEVWRTLGAAAVLAGAVGVPASFLAFSLLPALGQSSFLLVPAPLAVLGTIGLGSLVAATAWRRRTRLRASEEQEAAGEEPDAPAD